ncbi:MAG: amidohydrolase family protein [Deltaproteobacteria bacterium]
MHDFVIRNGTVVDGTGAERFEGDVAIDDGRISAIGRVAERGRREHDAKGRLVAPGWVDIHTHYDGQVTWDPVLAPSSWHGVTTIVMGNCGVGFAPVREDQHDFLIELMEGVEDIPGTALHEGIDWGWESFPEYMDVLEKMPRTMDIATQVPHCSVRAYVLGDRAHETEVTDDEISQMYRLTKEGIDAGAFGFTTSRTIIHSSVHGNVPGTFSEPRELLGIGQALKVKGGAMFEMVTDSLGGEPDRSWMEELARETGCGITYALAQQPGNPTLYRESLEAARRSTAGGGRIVPQVPCRPTGMLFGLQSSFHPFVGHPTYAGLAHLPLAERAAKLANPEVRARLLAEESLIQDPFARALLMNFEQIFPLGDPVDYEPAKEKSLAAQAQREGRSAEELLLDGLTANGGKNFFFAPLLNYAEYSHAPLREMMLHPNSVLGLSDGGAHCGLICDAGMPTYLLTHWARDRKRGERIALEQVVHLQTGRTAQVYGMNDRGTLEVGRKADVNIIDFDRLQTHVPEMIFDLPAGGRRLVQRVDGYDATIVAGEVTMEHGEPTGARPGRLVRADRS